MMFSKLHDVRRHFPVPTLYNSSVAFCGQMGGEAQLTSKLIIVRLTHSFFFPVRGLTELTREGEVQSGGSQMARRVRPSVRPFVRSRVEVMAFPKLFPPQTYHVHAFRDDQLGGRKPDHCGRV